MKPLVMAEIVSALAMGCIFLGMYVRRDSSKPAFRLKVVELCTIIWALADAGGVLLNGPQYPRFLIEMINLCAYAMDGLCLISFIFYCKAVVEEKVHVRGITFGISTIIVSVSFVWTIVDYVNRKMVFFRDGYTVWANEYSYIPTYLELFVMLTIPIYAATKHKIIGLKNVTMLGLFGVLPIITTVFCLVKGGDNYSPVAALLALIIVAELLQNDMVLSKEREHTRELEEKQLKLEEITCDQEAQYQEIIALNEQLEDNQERLQEALRERDEQLDEITGLNKSLGERMNIIQSMSKVYFSAFYVHLKDNSFTTIQSMEFIDKYLETCTDAQKGLITMCEYMVHPEYADKLREFVDFSTLNERMKGKTFITCDYYGNVAGWCQLYMIEAERDDEGNLETVFVAARTIHDEKMREEEQNRAIIEAREVAEKANAAKTIFLNNMSHDMRTPMNAILGFTELMEKEKNNPEVLTNYIEKMHHSGEYLLTIINNVLDMARIESGETDIDEEPYDMYDENTSATTILAELFKEKRMRFEKRVEVEHQYVLLDVTKVQQISVNLISNALKYTPEGGTVTMYLHEVPCEKEGYGRYTMEITDNGIGMSKEFQEHIFDYFSRERNTTESKVIGTGLGMSIVKRLVDLMGGTIEVESRLGEGTKFTVTLEHKIIDNPDDYMNKQRKLCADSVKVEGTRVLLAEDNELNAEIAIAIFGEHGLIIERAEDGVECVDMLNKSEPGYYDLVLMDIQMPYLNGYDATRKIRLLDDPAKSGIPIIAMTANAFDEDKKKALDAGMNAHLSKPIRIEEALKTISTVLLENA